VDCSDFPEEFQALWNRCKPFTMTSPERGFAMWTAVNHVVDAGIEGALVECGVWKGGSSMLMALTLLQRGAPLREIYMFDTFAGMTAPGVQDVDLYGRPAQALMEGAHGDDLAELVRAAAPIEEVREAIASTGYDMRLVRMVQGDVAQTLPGTQTLRIALLRLDTDFYDSTLAELTQLYPRLTRGGVLIIDDYGHWQGARGAVEAYFADPEVPYRAPLLWAPDYTGRCGVKIENEGAIEIGRYDYRPAGFEAPDLLELFPHARIKNPWQVNWPYLRREVPHIWRSDTRHEGYVTGNASVEEAACLYRLARPFAGRRGLEIGTHYGWTAAHLLAAGLELNCVDPAFADPQRRADVSAALDRVEGAGSFRLWDGYSPGCIPDVHAETGAPFSFVFIDGNHDGTAPAEDARGVIPFLAEDAVIVFHDLTSPFVTAGLDVFREAGFETCLYETMQILGIAWRGQVEIPSHPMDPNVPPIWLDHLHAHPSRSTGGRVSSSHSESSTMILSGKKAPMPQAASEPQAQGTWEDLITLRSGVEPDFALLPPAAAHEAADSRLHEWDGFDYRDALKRDTYPLPETADREGYYGPDHFSYWASGLQDARYLFDAAAQHGTPLNSYLDLGCASGRVLRHMALERPGIRAVGCDINRLHVEWCNAHLPPNCMTFQNHSVPSLPLEDNSIDMVSAFSVFTHIEALETAWLAEIRRVLRPGGLAWITVHTEHTLAEMTEDWPLWKPVMDHPKAATHLDAQRNFVGDRLVMRWQAQRSYSSNVFYKSEYLESRWTRILDLVELRRRFPTFQDVMLMRKPG
jgi:SAM-dependent methyltransferase/predicted O-methyltransferase YrrM